MVTLAGGLPEHASTRFFGRSQEAAGIRGALAGSRLVTLTGPGGVGKTRLAVRVAAEVAGEFPDGVFLAELSSARDAEGVSRAVAAALGPTAQSGPARAKAGEAGPPDESLAGRLRGRRLLLILDTAEHVLDACVALADAVLRGGDGAVLMVTSRQALDLPGEVVFRLGPLDVGDDGGDAVQLLADRTAAVLPGFAVTSGTLPSLVRLCRLLDGIPLAIELAALRLRAIGLDELLARLPGQLRLLASGRRAAAGEPWQSLAASVGWSYALCSPAERLLWTRLSAFADGFDLAAAEAICGPAAGDGGSGPEASVIDTLVGLVDKSIVLRAPDVGGTARYRLLAIVREHGAEHLADPAARASRHRGYYLSVARAFAASFIGKGQPGLVTALEADAANLRLAFDGALAAADAAAATELATACWPWLMCAGRYGQASSWLDQARALTCDRQDDDERARGSASPVPFPVTGVAAGEGAIASAARLASWSLAALGDIAGAEALRATLATPPAGADPGDHGGASRVAALIADLAAAFAALRRGAFAECVSRCADLEAGLPAGERWVRGWAAWVTGVAGWCAGDRVAAGTRLRAGLELFAPLRIELAQALHLEAFAWLAAGRRDYQRAARLQGSADRIWRRLAAREGARAPRLGLMLLHAERDWAERDARDALGASGYAAEHAAGAALSTDAAVASALPVSPGTWPSGSSAVPRPPAVTAAGDPGTDVAYRGRWEQLTAREREVAGLVAMGLTNRDIAARLVVSKRTVDAHLEHILGKLGYSSRVQVAALAARVQADGHGARR